MGIESGGPDDPFRLSSSPAQNQSRSCSPISSSPAFRLRLSPNPPWPQPPTRVTISPGFGTAACGLTLCAPAASMNSQARRKHHRGKRFSRVSQEYRQVYHHALRLLPARHDGRLRTIAGRPRQRNASKPLAAVKQQRHRAVVDQFHIHVGLEGAGFDSEALAGRDDVARPVGIT